MAAEHERFEALAVGHVLGGLDEDSASTFRSHLIGCRDCRLRVAELRDLASDLAAVERQERAQLRVKTELADAGGERDEGEQRPAGRAAGIGVLVLLALLAIVGFWNLHLRQTNAALLATTEVREDTLAQLSSGVAVPVVTAPRVAATVVVDEQQVAFTISGLPRLDEDERLVVWFEGSGARTLDYLPDQVIGGLAAYHLDLDGAQRMLVTVEEGGVPEAPSGDVLVEATLTPADSLAEDPAR